jgi:hypothetical protein
MTEYNNKQHRENLVQIVAVPQGMKLINLSEYDQLVRENNNLNLQILKLSNGERILKEIIETRDQTIEELRKENAELQIRLKNLEIELNIVKINNCNLNDKNIELENKITKLMTNFNNTQMSVDKLIAKQQYDKYVIAIQDVNSLIRMETQVDATTRHELQNLRKNRNEDCHYMIKNDDANINDGKRVILYDRLMNMPPLVKKMFDKNHPKLLDNITSLIRLSVVKLTVSAENEINEWWDE